MRVDTQTVTAQEATVILFARLGPLRAWGDFLADCIRGHQTYRGVKLMPCARQMDKTGNLRPVYSVADIDKFIRQVKRLEPTAGPTRIRPKTLALVPGRGWRAQKFDRNGDPIAWARRAIGFALPGQSLAH